MVKKYKKLDIPLEELETYGDFTLNLIAKGKPFQTKREGMRKPTHNQIVIAKFLVSMEESRKRFSEKRSKVKKPVFMELP